MKFKILLIILLTAIPLFAGWPTVPDSGIFVDYGIYPYLTVDPVDQSVCVVYHYSNQMRVKKYDKYGEPLWGGNFTLACESAGFNWHAQGSNKQWGAVISDQMGGVIICWTDFRNSSWSPYPVIQPLDNEVYLQRVDANGQVRYGANGKRISGPAAEGWHNIGDMKTDYHDGFILTYAKDIDSVKSYCKRYDLDGQLIWEKSFFASGNDLSAVDNDGNIFLNTVRTFRIFRRMKLDINGNTLWPDTLIGFLPDSEPYKGGGCFPDGEGGVIGVYKDQVNSTYPDFPIVVNRVDAQGNYLFGDSGIVAINHPVLFTRYAQDVSLGLYVSTFQIQIGDVVQRATRDGLLKFPGDGIWVAPDSISGGGLGLAADHEGGVLCFWTDKRHWPVKGFYGQRIDSTGQFLWGENGIMLHSTSNDPSFEGPVRYVYPDGRGGAVFLWMESGNGFQIFIKQISQNGNLGEVLAPIKKDDKPVLTSDFIVYPAYPNPFNAAVTLSFKTEKSTSVSIAVFDLLGREIYTFQEKKYPPGIHRIHWEGKDQSGKAQASGLYFYKIVAGNTVMSGKMLLVK